MGTYINFINCFPFIRLLLNFSVKCGLSSNDSDIYLTVFNFSSRPYLVTE